MSLAFYCKLPHADIQVRLRRLYAYRACYTHVRERCGIPDSQVNTNAITRGWLESPVYIRRLCQYISILGDQKFQSPTFECILQFNARESKLVQWKAKAFIMRVLYI